MRISDWSSDVCSSDLSGSQDCRLIRTAIHGHLTLGQCLNQYIVVERRQRSTRCNGLAKQIGRATSELQSLMRISYAVFCLKKKKKKKKQKATITKKYKYI